jgi:hypothetical protein
VKAAGPISGTRCGNRSCRTATPTEAAVTTSTRGAIIGRMEPQDEQQAEGCGAGTDDHAADVARIGHCRNPAAVRGTIPVSLPGLRSGL